MLEIKDLNFTYNKDELVLSNINIKIKKGEFIGIIGPNGSGKSTLMKLTAGLLETNSGTILYNQKDIREINKKEWAKICTMMLQEFSIYFDFEVKEIIDLAAFPYSSLFNTKDIDKEMLIEVLDKLDIPNLYNRSFFQLSGGEKKLVLIAKTILQNTDFILLDEAAANLDLKHKYNLYKYLLELNSNGKTIISTFHDLNFALKFCKRIVILKNGRVQSDGPPQNSISKELLENTYEVPFKITEKNGLIQTDVEIN